MALSPRMFIWLNQPDLSTHNILYMFENCAKRFTGSNKHQGLGNDYKFINVFVQKLNDMFSLKDLGDLHHFLGVEVISTSNGLFLSQHKHIRYILLGYGMHGAKEVSTPMCTAIVLTQSDGNTTAIDASVYCKTIGQLQYLAMTRPDVAFSTNKLSQYMHNPSKIHWHALKDYFDI
ncbi:uncharacterized mitochondrial protein AtMg00810-like [Rutidosis leptorrhynchoides]|uniref:uncharacterized mitochondrial protein AtMg00810-like n=1 Tax=Rutidosis leptorrhynchoides TaxID=125765 RepID=UPI003A99BD27